MKTIITIFVVNILLFLSACVLTSTLTPTPQPTLTPASTATITPSPTPTVIPLHPAGKIQFHERNENIKYNWFSFLPTNIIKEEPLYIWINNANAAVPPIDDYDEFTDHASGWAWFSKELAEEYHLVSLVPVLPRPKTNHVYTVAYDWKVFLPSSDPFVQHPEQVINLMIDQLIEELSHDGYNIQPKVFIEGYSAGCMFAQRFTILHPERIKAMAGGQCGGSLVMPFGEIDGEEIDWPLGINDFDSLIGFEFNEKDFRNVPHFIYIGNKDTTNATFWGPGELWKSWGQINQLKKLFGKTEPEIIENQVKYLENNGYSLFEFRLYPRLGHVYTDEMIKDSLDFFAKFKND